jgi:uncharacterized protein YecT (DUF1311 family)
VIGRRLAAGALAALLAATACKQSAKPSPGESSGAQTSPAGDSGASRVTRQATEAASVTALVPAPAGSTGATAPDAASPAAGDPDAPTNFACRQAKREAKGEAKTQADMTTQAAAGAVLAGCDLRVARDKLAMELAHDPKAAAALEDSQQKWRAFREAHEAERSPHADEPGFYGTVFPMCQSMERSAMRHARQAELDGLGRCAPGPSAPAQAGAARTADAALNDVYRNVRTAYAKDPKFLAALQQAEVAWIAYRDAQVALAAAATGDAGSACAQHELERTTQARTTQLREWLKTPQDGDVCSLGVAPP